MTTRDLIILLVLFFSAITAALFLGVTSTSSPAVYKSNLSDVLIIHTYQLRINELQIENNSFKSDCIEQKLEQLSEYKTIDFPCVIPATENKNEAEILKLEAQIETKMQEIKNAQ